MNPGNATSRPLAIVFASLAFAAVSSGSLAAAEPAKQLAKQIDQLAQPYIDSETVVGMSIGVLYGDKTLVRGYGKLSQDDPRKPDGKTIYEIGSITKTFTGLLLADAVAKGDVSLTTPVQDLLPDGVSLKAYDDESPIELVHLATHASGLPRLPGNFAPADGNNPYADYDDQRLADFLRSYQPTKNPGEAIAYSNLGAGLLGNVLAAHEKETYESLLAARITKPLGMHDTGIALKEELKNRLAPPHVDGGAPGHTWNIDALAGAGAIRSDVNDMLKYARAYLHPPKGRLGEAIETAWKIHQQPIEAKDFAMGLGWHVARDGETRWHTGQTGGYHSSIYINRKLNVAVVVLTNTATSETDALAEQIVRMLAGVNEKPREFAQYVKVSPENMQRYAGKFQLAPGAVFTVSVEGDKLMVGLSGQPTFRVYPHSDTEWKYTVVEATLTFQVDDEGKCDAVELFQNGVRQMAKRIE
ncbi:serine hydrolase [Blastopirellula sp. JC732]|uniref:Serine hydrolase n=1 Tax=Blastopirellula sediminis TaxID=2894196 RepID=A0A9X1MH69_9BACT|nr:serine hydrolase [Blastopirellula sediminis]MCC9608174.1 serine hydrolase [Blastopirellula sediminis]MCC9627033.1 serine hydrolase [Blastopirellula sediminis]